MAFALNGFLGDEAQRASEDIKKKYQSHFEYARVLNKMAHEALTFVTAHSNDALECCAVSLYLRIINSYCAMLRLMEYGIGQEAGNVLRSCTESTIFLKKLSSDPTWVSSYIQASENQRLKIINLILEDKDGDFNFLQTDLQQLRETKEKLKNQIDPKAPKKLHVEAIAKTIGLSPLYNSTYRFLSTISTHSSARSLMQFVNTDSTGKIISIQHGPQLQDYELLFFTGGSLLCNAIESLLGCFKIDSTLIKPFLDRFKNQKEVFTSPKKSR